MKSKKMKRLIKAGKINSEVISSLCNWIENRVEMSNSEYEQLLNEYSISGTCYRVLGFEFKDFEKAICDYYDVDLYDDNSGIDTTRSEFCSALKTLIKDDIGRPCSWTKDIDAIDDLISDACDYYDILIVIEANVEGVDITAVMEDHEDEMSDILYGYQKEVLGTQSGSSEVFEVYLSNYLIYLPEVGDLNEFLNCFE